MTQDDREDRLPVWTQTLINKLRYDLRQEKATVTVFEKENERLRILLAEKATEKGDSNTFLLNEDTEDELPLGESPEIRFGRFTVQLQGDELSVAGDDSLAVWPTDWSLEVLIVQR